MASAGTLRCLVRPTIPIASRIQPVIVSTASFSTSSSLSAVAPPAIKDRKALTQGVKKSFNKKKGPIVPVKKPNPGERKAFRKRVQLSNNSALEVKGLSSLEKDTLKKDESACSVVCLPDAVVDQLRTLEAFKPTQSWGLFRKPHFLVRKETVELIKKLEEAGASKKALKCVLTGSRLSGKSMMLLQAMSHALLNSWVVINIPEAQDLTNGNTEYSQVAESEPLQFAQPVYTLKLLQNILKANKAVLAELKVQKDWSKLSPLDKGASLEDLILSCKEAEYAWPTLNALWTELTLSGRPPVLLGLDGLAHINRFSEYRDPSFKPVHSHDLTLIGMFVKALSGQTNLPNGGAIIASTSESNVLYPPSQQLALSQLEAGQAGKEIPKPNPYERKYDNRVYDALKNSHVHRVEGVSKEEGRVLMEYWGASGMTKTLINNRTVVEKWSLGGHGIVGEMERASLMTMRM